jgi:predicted nuclease of restriction endonuclease-like (RecB) superfamily
MQLQNTEYKQFILDIKSKIQSSQIKASIKVNVELLKLYWDISAMIVEKQKKSSWGDGFIKDISRDLKVEFPSMKGFSVTNIKYMRSWYLFWFEKSPQLVDKLDKNIKSPQLVAQIFQIPWGHNREIITKCKDYYQAVFYIEKTIENAWSRAVLIHQIESNLYARDKKSINNFNTTLTTPQSDLAKALLKDPYNFDFLTLTEKHDELELESSLMEHMTNFLLELGSGFAFVGRQYKLVVGGDEFKIDLLFYHIKLKCYIVVELKTVKFKPEFAGQLNFYVSAVDGEVRELNDNPTLGILICKSKNDTVVEYALQRIDSPIGVSQYELTQVLPDEFKSSLPSIKDIEAEFGGSE